MTETPDAPTCPRRRRQPRRRRTGQAGARGSRGHLGGALEGRRHLPLRPHPAARERLLDRHSAADRQRQPARRPRLLLHAPRPDRPLPADERQVGVLPDGLGRQRPADRAPGAELLRRALRPVAALRRRLHAAGEAGPQAAGADQPAQLHRALRASSSRPTSRSSSRCGARSASRWTGRSTTRPSGRRPSWSASARSCATSPAARPTSRRRRPSGTSPSRPRSPRPSSRRASTPATTTGSPSTGADGTPVHIETTRPELIPAVVALIAHPDDERYAACSARPSPARCSGSRSRSSPTRWPSPTRAPASRCAARSATSPTSPWWRELDLPVRTVVGRDGRLHRETPEWLAGAGAAAYQQLAGKTAFSAREAMVGAAARVRRPRRRAQPDPADDELLREGRQAARDRRHPPVVHPQRRPRRRAARRDARARRRDRLVPAAHAAPLRQLGGRPQRRLADLAASASSASRSRSGTRSTTRASPTTTTRCCPPRPTCRSTRPRVAPQGTTRRSAASRAASSATPT